MARLSKHQRPVREIKRGNLIIFGGRIYRVYANVVYPYSNWKFNNLTLVDDSLNPTSTLDLIGVEIPSDLEIEILILED